MQLLETVSRYQIHREKGVQDQWRRENRYLSIIARRNRDATPSQISHDFYAATGTRISRVTVSRMLHKEGFFGRKPAIYVPLTSTNKRVRIE